MLHFIILSVYYSNDLKSSQPVSQGKKVFFRFILLLNTLIQTIFTLPFFITLFSFFPQNSKGYLICYPTVEFTAIANIINLVFSIVSIMMFCIIIVLNSLFLNDNRSKTDLPWASPRSFIYFIKYFLKFFLMIFFTFDLGLSHYPAKQSMIMILTTLIIGIRMLNPVGFNANIFNLTVLYEGGCFGRSILAILTRNALHASSIEVVIFNVLFFLFFGGVFLYIIFRIQNHYKYQNVIFVF